ncbi:hypothetical protein ACQEV4_15780 [Streptomyces shenzhenensis]|uniref:hypothetical protein n=1 Tax=Streptomyces shenzhenensis TaxID=943815 RepID=UPI003D92E194
MTYLPPKLVLGTRDSDLAMVQAAHVAGLLERVFPQVAVRVKAVSDLYQGPLAEIGGKAVWVGELDRALATARVDVSVSCAKDLPGPHERGPGGLVENITQLLRGEGVERLLPR